MGAVEQMKNLAIDPALISAIAKAWGADGALTVPSPDQSIYSCKTPQSRGAGDLRLRRLSESELHHTFESLLGANPTVALPSFQRMPPDKILNDFSEFIPEHNFQHLEAIFNISSETAQFFIANPTKFANFGSSCLQQELANKAITQACLSTFISKFGRRVFRRPLSAAEGQKYLSILTSKDASLNALSVSERLQILITQMLQNPEVYFHFNTTVGQKSGNRIRLDAYTVASRLSFRLTGAPPDEQLLDAAASGQLKDLSGVRTQVERLMLLPAAKRHIREAVRYWLKLEEVAAPAEVSMTRLGLNSSSEFREQWKNEVISETLDFVEHFIFNGNGTFQDLMSSNLAFPKTAHLANFMNAQQVADQSVGSISQDGRQGLLARPAVLISNLERERPIHRGLLVRTRILCDVIPPPPPNTDQAASDNLGTRDPLSFTTRELTYHTTKSSSCVSCHSQINPIGFTLNGFGPMGELRTTEKIYKPNGDLANEFPVDSSAQFLQISSENDHVTNYDELVSLVAGSSKARACLPKIMFEFNRVRAATQNDYCALSEIEKTIREGRSLREMVIMGIANEDIFCKGL